MNGSSGPVPPAVLAAFALEETPKFLPGGQGKTWRSGNAVLKPSDNAEEAAWTASVFVTIGGPGFRVPRPVAAVDGRYVVDGWVAWQWLEGEPAGPNGGRWPETIEACRAFHSALVGIPCPDFLDQRSDPWSEADRIAWSEAPLDVAGPFAGPARRLAELLQPIHHAPQVIHGDFTANVLFANGVPPAVIDFSPYWRAPEFAIAVIVTDALTWGGADRSILDLVGDVPEFPQLFVRATLRRVLEADRFHRRGRRGLSGGLFAWTPVVALAEELAGRTG